MHVSSGTSAQEISVKASTGYGTSYPITLSRGEKTSGLEAAEPVIRLVPTENATGENINVGTWKMIGLPALMIQQGREANFTTMGSVAQRGRGLFPRAARGETPLRIYLTSAKRNGPHPKQIFCQSIVKRHLMAKVRLG